MNYFGQAQQDRFALEVHNFKRDGYFVELGAHHPKNINNTYLLESEFGWRGLMMEKDPGFLDLYHAERGNSFPVIVDATKVNYANLFKDYRVPNHIDFLSMDLEAANGSTLEALQRLEAVMPDYLFGAVCFEHDVWRTQTGETRERSLEIFQDHGYHLVFKDIHNRHPQFVYEHWFVHPQLVDMTFINQLIADNQQHYVENPVSGTSIGWDCIVYPERSRSDR